MLWFVKFGSSYYMVWIRGTLLRFRYDQFMKFGWKALIPASLVWLFMVMFFKATIVFWEIDLYELVRRIRIFFHLLYSHCNCGNNRCTVYVSKVVKDGKDENTAQKLKLRKKN